MVFGFPAYYSDGYSAGGTLTALRTAVRNALDSLSWSIREETTERLLTSTSMNLRSWGEKILICFLDDNTITVTSKCAFPTQCFDWGKNKANVQKFIEELKKHV